MENKNIYVGHRYVPKIMGEHDKTQTYEGLSIVTHEGTSYTSKKHVPVGVDISNEEYWVVTGNYNVQVEKYRTEVNRFKNEINTDMKQMYDDFENITNSKADLITSNLIVNVPNDYNNITDAITDIGNKYAGTNTKVTIDIDPDFIINENIVLENSDYSYITLYSTGTLKFSDNYKGNFLRGINCKLPRFNILIDMEDKGDRGLSIEDNSSIFIGRDSGVLNSGGTCIYVRRSTVRGSYAKFNGGNNRNGWFTRSSVVSLPECNFDDCKKGGYAVYVSRASIADFSNSTINNSNADSSNLHVLRSRVNFIEGKAIGGKTNGITGTQGSSVSCRGAEVSGMGGHGISAIDTSNIDANDTKISDCGGIGLNASTSGTINGINTNITNCDVGVSISHGSSANINNSIVKNNTSDINVFSGGILSVTGCETTNGISSIQDTNVSSFNTVSRGGIIFDNNITDMGDYETGTFTDVTTTLGDRVIPHNLGRTPNKINFYLYGENEEPLTLQLVSKGSKSFKIKFYNIDGSLAIHKNFTIYYEVGI